MNRWKRAAGIATVGIALVMVQAACGGAPNGAHPGRGVVTHLDVEARKVTLDHGDIPGLMKGMTMTFEVAPGVPLDGIAAGAEVDFRAKEEGGVYSVTEIRRSGS